MLCKKANLEACGGGCWGCGSYLVSVVESGTDIMSDLSLGL